jgi:hypothetical protein
MPRDQKIYQSFEEFEREELRSMETMGASVDDMIDALYGGEELDFGSESRRSKGWQDDAEDEE